MPWGEKTVLKIRENELLPSVVRMWVWAYVCSFDFECVGLTFPTRATNQRKP